MAHVIKQLGQSRPAGTTAASIYNPAANTETLLYIVVCNTTTSPAKFSIFHDTDGSTYDQTTALAYNIDIPANTSITFPEAGQRIAINSSSGNVAIKTDTASALTFTAYGEEFTATI